MKIMLTNDDGYKANGIRVLHSVLASRGHEVFIVAPESQRSSVSHSISDCRTLPFMKETDNIFHFDAQPADCIMQSIGYKRLDIHPDLVVSGINHGFNLSIDIIYSGTCAAAREAAIWGYPAIAISAAVDASLDEAALFLADNLEKFLSIIEPDYFLNINVPVGSQSAWEVASSLEIRHRDCNGDEKSMLCKCTNDYSDIAICNRGCISVGAIDVRPHLNSKGSALLNDLHKEKQA